MCFAPQVNARHVGPNHRQAFHFHFSILLAGFIAILLHPFIHLSERDSPGWPNVDSNLGERCESLANV
jgi:hypothetical protein